MIDLFYYYNEIGSEDHPLLLMYKALVPVEASWVVQYPGVMCVVLFVGGCWVCCVQGCFFATLLAKIVRKYRKTNYPVKKIIQSNNLNNP